MKETVFYVTNQYGLSTIDASTTNSIICAKDRCSALCEYGRESLLNIDVKYNSVTNKITVDILDSSVIISAECTLYELELPEGKGTPSGKDFVMVNSPLKVIKEISYDNWIKAITEYKDKVVVSYPNGISMMQALAQGGFYDDNGLWNSLIMDTASGAICRHRVETLVISNNRIFLRITNRSMQGYRIPGGGSERCTGSDVLQAEHECNEEAKLNVKNIVYSGVTYTEIIGPPKNITRGCNLVWEGKITDVYVADYAGRFVGKVNPLDLDKDMKDSGRFYSLSEVYHMLRKEHKEALKFYFDNVCENKEKFPIPKEVYEEAVNAKNVGQLKQLFECTYDGEEGYNDDMLTSNVVDKMITDCLSTTEELPSELPECLPCFTPEEINNLGVFNEEPSKNFYNVVSTMKSKEWFDEYSITGNPGNNWYNNVCNLYESFKGQLTASNKQRLLEAGWNPEVELCMENVIHASAITKEKLKDLISESIIQVINTTFVNEDGLTDNATDLMMKYRDLCFGILIEYLHNNAIDYMNPVFNLCESWNSDGSLNAIEYNMEPIKKDKDKIPSVIIAYIQHCNRQLLQQGIIHYKLKEIPLATMEDRGFIILYQVAESGDISYINGF